MKKISSSLLMLLCVFVLKADNTPNTFTEDEILDSIKQKMNVVKPVNKQNENKLKTIAKKLKDYKVTGFSFCIDPNFAFIYDSQNPTFEVKYKNEKGEIKKRKYESYIQSIGLKLEFTFKFNLIFFLGTDLDFYNTNKEIDLGYGIDIDSTFCDITYANFNNAPGGILIIGIPVPQVAFKSPDTLKLLSDPMNIQANVAENKIKKAEAFAESFIADFFYIGYPPAVKTQLKAQLIEKQKQKTPSIVDIFLNLGIGASMVFGGKLIPVKN